MELQYCEKVSGLEARSLHVRPSLATNHVILSMPADMSVSQSPRPYSDSTKRNKFCGPLLAHIPILEKKSLQFKVIEPSTSDMTCFILLIVLFYLILSIRD